MSECHRTKILSKGIMIVFKTKGPQVRCIPHGSFGLSQCTCKSSCKKTCWLTKSKDMNKFYKKIRKYVRGTQRQFSENICSEEVLRSRIFGTFVVKFLAFLPLLGFSNI